MEPKFQSTFIPKGPSASTVSMPTAMGAKVRNHNFFSFIAGLIFTISLLMAIGVYGYKFYLNKHIAQLDQDLNAARAALQPEVVDDLIKLDNKLITAQTLLNKHVAVSPIFALLQQITPKTVRYSDFLFVMGDNGLELAMRGEARGYAVLAVLSNIFHQNPNFKDIIFSDLTLNDKGDVAFGMKAVLQGDLVSYPKLVEKSGVVQLPASPTATSSRPSIATSSRATSTTSSHPTL